jgi:hypothetical protein
MSAASKGFGPPGIRAEEMQVRFGEPMPPPAPRRLLGPEGMPMARNRFQNLRERRVVPTEIVCRER